MAKRKKLKMGLCPRCGGPGNNPAGYSYCSPCQAQYLFEKRMLETGGTETWEEHRAAKAARVGKCACGNPVRESGPGAKPQRDCRLCHAQSVGDSRFRHPLAGEALVKANARSYLNVYVRRGKVKRMPCEHCGSDRVQAFHEDYAKPLQVRWLCRPEAFRLRAEGNEQKRLDNGIAVS